MSPTAVEALARPVADPITGGAVAPDFELEAIRNEVDVDQLLMDYTKFRKYSVDIRGSVTDASVELSIDGAHELTITVHDPERSLARSGIFDYAVDLEVRGWWWRFTKVEKSGDDFTLYFEPRVVSWLRALHKKRKAKRGKITRAEFVLMLIREVKRRKIKLFCPELHKTQPIEKADQRDEQGRASRREPGLDTGYAIFIDGTRADNSVMRNLERVLTVGYKKGARRKVQVATMMCVLQESRGKTSATNGVHVGLFQQDPAYWPATREPERDANAWYDAVMKSDKQDPHQKLTGLIESIQRSGKPGNYAQWRDEAEDLVNHFYDKTSPHTFTVTHKKPYEFRVKHSDKNYWGTILRLADEVAWSAFTIKDTLYFISQEDLFRSKSRMTIKEGENGVDSIDYNDDVRRSVKELVVTCRMDMWDAPLGSVVTVDDPAVDGPGNADRYLVVDLQRSYFSRTGTVTLRKPQKDKPEPAPEIVTKTITSGAGSDVSGSVTLKGSTRDKILEYARSTMTTRTGYRRYSKYGATTLDPTPPAPNRSDCSQWTRAIFYHITRHDIGLNTWAQIANGRRTQHPKPGDLMFPVGGGHVEIYAGGKTTIGHGSPPIDYGNLDYWSHHFFITFDFLDDD